MKKINLLTISLLFLSLTFLSGCSFEEIKSKVTNLFSSDEMEQTSGYDAFAQIGLSFEGIAPFGKLEILGSPKQITDNFSITYYADKTDNLKNGDIVTIYCDFDETLAKENEIEITQKEKSVEVTGLNEEYISDINTIPDEMFNKLDEFCKNRIKIMLSTDEYKKVLAALVDGNEDRTLKYSGVILDDFKARLINMCLQVKNEASDWREANLNKLILTYEITASIMDEKGANPYDVKIYIGYGLANTTLKEGNYKEFEAKDVIEFGKSLDYDSYRNEVIDQYGSTYMILEKDIVIPEGEELTGTKKEQPEPESEEKEKENSENKENTSKKEEEETESSQNKEKEDPLLSNNNNPIVFGNDSKIITISDISNDTIYAVEEGYITIPAKRYNVGDSATGSDGNTYAIVDMQELADAENYDYYSLYDYINEYGSNPELAIKGYDSYEDMYYLYAFSKKEDNKYRLSALFPYFGPIVSGSTTKEYKVSSSAKIALLTYSNSTDGTRFTQKDLFSIPFNYIEPEYNGEVLLFFEPGMQVQIEADADMITKMKQIN